MNLPNPNTMKGQRLVVPIAIQAEVYPWPASFGTEDEVSPYESYIAVTFHSQFDKATGKWAWKVLAS